ncbi:MAG: hypothetical protein ABJH21_02125, partial [Parasphingorhabdus sp.]
MLKKRAEKYQTFVDFVDCYWHQSADYVYGTIDKAAKEFAMDNEIELSRRLIADFCDIIAERGFPLKNTTPRLSTPKPKYAKYLNGPAWITITKPEAEIVVAALEKHCDQHKQ